MNWKTKKGGLLILVHIREVRGSSPFAPTVSKPWTENQGFFVLSPLP